MSCNRGRRWGLVLAVLIAAGGRWAVGEPLIDHPMFQDPPCGNVTNKYHFPPQLVDLWKQALERPDSELRREAADTVVMAHRRGMPGLSSLEGPLAGLLARPGEGAVVRRSAARALVELDARDRADLLADVAATDGLEVAQIIEPALAKWGNKRFRQAWLQRLEDPTTQLLWRLLAVQCLVASNDAAAQPLLLPLVREEHGPAALRLAAAEALGVLSGEGLVGESRRLAADRSAAGVFRRVLAVAMVAGHRDPEAVALFRELATDAEPAVAAAAFERLLDIDPALTFDLAAGAVRSSDVKVRRAGARALIAKSDTESVRVLAPLLDDPNPALRRWITQSLVDLAGKAELRGEVLTQVEAILASGQWRGLEQATMVVVLLEHKVVSGRMIELLQHGRPEVSVAACFALRRFRLPETLPAMLEFATGQYQKLAVTRVLPHEQMLINDQHAQLFQAFGEMRFHAAEGLMRKLVPKNFLFMPASRAAACWSLGYLHEGVEDPGLAGQFVARLLDTNTDEPEVPEVRRMCAVSLGRMKAASALSELEAITAAEGKFTDVGQACGWAVEQITGVPRPELAEIPQFVIGWFLQPASTK